MMGELCVFSRPKESIEHILNDLGLHMEKVASDDRTTIYQNDIVRMSFDKSVIRVNLFDKKNEKILESMREYFYGDEYASI